MARAYVPLPFAQPRYVGDPSRLEAIYGDTGRQLAQIDLQRGNATAAALARLGEIYGGYVQAGKAEKATAAALAERHAELAANEKLKRDEMEAAATERKAVRGERQTQEEREAARYTMERTRPGEISQAQAALFARFPELASRVTTTETLPARPVVPEAGPMAPPRSMSVLEATPEQADRAAAVQRQKEIDAANAANMIEDNRRAAEAAAGTKDYQTKSLAIAQQNADTSRQNANTTAKRYGTSGLDTTNLSPDYADALDSALMTFTTAKRGPVVAQANRAAATGDAKRVAEIIQEATMAGENVDARNQVNGRRATMAAMQDARGMLAEMKAAGVPTNWLSGTAEDLARKLGTSTDPKYVTFKTRLNDALVQYRRAATGVQFSEAEARDYAKMFPNYSQTLPVNEATINGLMRAMQSNDRSYWEGKLGKKGAQLVIGDDAPPPTSSRPKITKIELVKP